MLLNQRRISLPKHSGLSGYFSKSEQPITSTASAMDVSWVGSLSLKRIARPGLENERHRDTSLKVTIHESKNLPPQKRYFCDICLDRKLYARTTSKLFKDSVFWGECFDLNNLPELSFITINLYKEADYSKESKRRKSSKCQNQLMAYLTLAVADLSSKYESQQWHTMQLVNSSTSNTSPLSSMSIASSATTPFSLLQQSSETESCASSLSNIFSASDRTVGGSGGGQATTTNKRSISVAGTAPISSGLLLMGNKSRRAIKYSLGSCEGRLSSLGASLSSSHQNSNLPQIRLVVQYQSVDVLPLAYYDDLRKFVVEKYLPLVEFLEPLLSTKKKEEIARCLVNIHEKADNSDVAEFLAGIVNHELDSYENLSLLFRSNSIGSKAVESYVKLVGAEYLQNLFRTFIENLITSTDDLEVDPTRLPDANSSPQTSSPSSVISSPESENNSRLVQNQRALMNLVNVVWTKVKASLDYFPHDLRESLASIRRTVEIRHGEEVADQMISGCLFLRYLCPALHGPALFGLTNAVPDEPRVSRNLTLIAKVLQTMANFSHFETKENYMRFMNDFVLATTNEMRSYLRAVSTTTSSINGGGTDVDRDIWIKRTNAMYNCHGSIDLGYELTMMHKYLSAVLEAHPNIPEEINELPNLLRSISQLSTASNLRRSTSGLTSTDSSVSVDHYLREGTQVHGTMAAPMFSHREPKISTISAPQGLGSPGGLEYRPGQLEGHSVNPRNMLYSGLSRRNVSSNPSLLKLDTTDESKSPVKFDNNSENAENEVAIGEVGAGIDSESERLDEKDCLCPTKDQQFFGDNFEFHENSEPAVKATQSKHYADGELCSINEGVVDTFEPTRSISVASTPAKVFCPPPRPPISSSNLRTPNSPVVSSANQRGRSNSFKQRTSLKSAVPTAAVEREKPMEKVSSPRLDRLNGSLRRTSSRNSLRGSLAAVKSPTWDRDSQAGISVSPALYHKWPSGPDIHSLAADGPELAPVAARPTLTLHFPPPPPVPATTGITSDSIAPPVGELRSTGWSGSCTNIRMGTRAIRMSRERDLSGLGTTGSAATAVSVAERDHSTDVPQISPVPVILQCTEVVNPATAAKVPVVGSSNDYEYPLPGGSRSIASASSSDLSRAPDAASNLTWPEEGSAAAGGTYVNENLGPVLSMRWPGRPPAARESETTAVVDAFHVSDSSSASQNLCPREAPIEADPFVPASVHRQRRNIVSTDSSAAVSTTTNNAPSQAAGSEDDALLAKVYNFLFGNVGAKEPVWGRDQGCRATESENLYQNYQRDSPHGQFVDSGMESLESSHLESLESRLRIMEEQVQQGRNDFQQPAASNNRLQMQDQDMGVNELINQIRLLRLMRQRDAVGHSSSSSSSANLGFPNQNVREILSPPGSAFTFESTRDAQRPDPLTACRTENGCLRPGETPPAPYWTNSSLFDRHPGMPLPLSDPMEAGAATLPFCLSFDS
ncbi:hypothetical protein AAHC03_09516 [Spirometra sp. Aus1]